MEDLSYLSPSYKSCFPLQTIIHLNIEEKVSSIPFIFSTFLEKGSHRFISSLKTPGFAMAGHNNDEMGDEAVSPDNTSQAEETENISEEYNQLDSKLDELNSALDFLEQKNDNIHAQLIELLNSSREIRQQLRQENVSSEDSATNSQPKQQES